LSRLRCLPALLAVLLATATGRAQLSQAVQPDNAALASSAGEAVNERYWTQGRSRLFQAATLELGLSYVRAQLASGYGKPHYSWVGLEGWTGVSPSSFGEYLGLRGALPWGYLRSGVRYQATFERSILPIQERYTREDLDTPIGDPWQYFIFEAEAAASAHLPFGTLTGLAGGYYFTLVPERDAAIFEESLKVVATQPWLWRARGSYSFALGRDGGARVGTAAEVIGMPNRDAFVVRAGLFGSVAVTRHLEVLAMLLPVWYSPDRLGLLGAEFGQLGVRLRYATDESKPDPRD
jgi:hypothetical protein